MIHAIISDKKYVLYLQNFNKRCLLISIYIKIDKPGMKFFYMRE